MIDWLKSMVRAEAARVVNRPSPTHVAVLSEVAQLRETIRSLREQHDFLLGVLAATQTELHEMEERLIQQEADTRRILYPSVEAGG